jgi:hypothetical protein
MMPSNDLFQQGKFIKKRVMMETRIPVCGPFRCDVPYCPAKKRSHAPWHATIGGQFPDGPRSGNTCIDILKRHSQVTANAGRLEPKTAAPQGSSRSRSRSCLALSRRPDKERQPGCSSCAGCSRDHLAVCLACAAMRARQQSQLHNK